LRNLTWMDLTESIKMRSPMLEELVIGNEHYNDYHSLDM
jgi:hypothetical protein